MCLMMNYQYQQILKTSKEDGINASYAARILKVEIPDFFFILFYQLIILKIQALVNLILISLIYKNIQLF